MKQGNLAKIKWTDERIDLYKKVLNEEIPEGIAPQKLRTIVKNINIYGLELDDKKETIIYTPNNVKIISPSKYDDKSWENRGYVPSSSINTKSYVKRTNTYGKSGQVSAD